MKRKIAKKHIIWILSDNYMVALGKLQATIYYTYDLTNRIPFDKMRRKVLKSRPDEYSSWADIMELANECGLIGHNARFREEWFES